MQCCSRLPVCTAPLRIIARGGMCSVWRLLAKPHTHTYAPTRTFYSPAFRSVGSSFKLRSPSLDRDPILELKTMMIAIVAIYGVALTTRFAEGDDVDVVADTRFFPPRRGAFLAVSCPPVGVLFQDSCANKFPPPARRFLPISDRLSRVNVILVCCSLLQFPSSSKRCPQRYVVGLFFFLLS